MRLMATAALLALQTPTLAAEVIQAETDIDLANCTVMHSDDFSNEWGCPGYKGYPLRIVESGLSFYVSYGFGAADEPAAKQTPPVPNVVGSRIEWRLSDASGAFRPVATIVRYQLEGKGDEADGEVLVVTQLGPGVTCHVAYVDAKASGDPDALAREAADRLTPGFNCAGGPEKIGEFAAW